MGKSAVHTTRVSAPAMIKRLSEMNFVGGSGAPMSVCVVSSEFLGPVKNGGIATATSGLLNQLVADGHKVTLLYTLVENGKPVSGDKPWEHWVDALGAKGIIVKHIPHRGRYRSWLDKSWQVKEFIGSADFDFVYFNESHGNGYYSLAAKRAGLGPYSEQLYCVITHGSTEWVCDINDQYACDASDLEMMGLERRSVELADVVIGPSSYLLQKYESYGWRLPAQTFVQPYPLLQNPRTNSQKRRIQIDELVFFGRLEIRKGLWLFCEALDRFSNRLTGKVVTFLGRATDASGLSSDLQIINRSSNWPFRVKLLTDFNQEEALSYLSGAGRLAVMPSLADNSPCVIYECMEAGIPFVSTLGSGADELVDPSCWDDMMVQPNTAALSELLARILDHGARLGRPRFNPKDNLATWSAWHQHVAENRTDLLKTAFSSSPIVKFELNSKNSLVPLIVVIDRGACSLSLLIANLSSHIKRFGQRAAYLILSSRRGDLQHALFDMFNGAPGSAPVSICVSDSTAVEQAREVILASSSVFFADAETEILTPFFVLALNILSQQNPVVVSCAAAVRRDIGAKPEIEELPSGDIPGLSGIGYPIGGAVWGVSTKGLICELSSLELYDKQMDALNSALVLGQSLMHRCRLSKVPLQILPMVGAVETRTSSDLRRNHFKEAQLSAAALGISPTVHLGGATWFAMSKSRTHLQRQERVPVECSSFLSPEHPLTSIQVSSENSGLAELAAAIGRPELSLQIEAGNGTTRERVRQMMALATRSMRLRPTMDLAELLVAGSIMEFGGHPLPEMMDRDKKPSLSRNATMQGKQLAQTDIRDGSSLALRNDAADELQEHGNTNETMVYVDSRYLRVRNKRIQSTNNLPPKNPGKLFFFDVPLCGNSMFTAKLRATSSKPPLMHIKVIDQRNGELIGTASVRPLPQEASEASIRLHEVYGLAAIVFEFIGVAKMEIIVEAMRVE